MSRSISMRGTTYQRLAEYCDANGLGYSATAQKWIKEELDAKGAPVPDSETPPKKRAPSTEEAEEIAGQHFTF